MHVHCGSECLELEYIVWLSEAERISVGYEARTVSRNLAGAFEGQARG